MNVFILNTGRCGSTTFIRACAFIDNYTVGHESRTRLLRPEHLKYPENHIEADNRLVWFLGEIEEIYENNAYYVHLKRNIDEVACSYARRRFKGGILRAYYESIKMGANLKKFENLTEEEYLLYAKDYVITVRKNIDNFLKNKKNVLNIELENIQDEFCQFWKLISATGDYESALREFEIKYNESNNYVNCRDKKSELGGIYRVVARLRDVFCSR